MDPFRNYDAWLEAPIQRMYAEAEREVEAWQEFCEARNGFPADIDDDEDAVVMVTVDTIVGPVQVPQRTPLVPVHAFNEGHPDHAIYKAWLALETLIQAREDRLQAESEADYYNQLAEDEAMAQEDLI